MGEFTAVASAKRAVRGDFSDGALVEGAVESWEDDRGRETIVTLLFFWLFDMSVRYVMLDAQLGLGIV